MKIAHLSDPHFGTEVPAVVTALQAALSELRPDMIVVSGDITQRARAAQFAAAAAFIDSLPPVPKLLVPGNHDLPLFNLPLRLLLPDHGYRSAFGATEQERIAGRVSVIGFDATLRLRHTRGSLRPEHVRLRMAASADPANPADPSRWRIAVVHQPLHTLLDEDRDECLIGAAAIADALAGCGADLVLSGHVHMPLLADTRAIFAGLPRHFVLSGAGTAVSWRTRPGAPNSFNLLQLDDATRRMTLTLHAFDAATQVFRPDYARAFALQADGWLTEPAAPRPSGLSSGPNTRQRTARHPSAG